MDLRTRLLRAGVPQAPWNRQPQRSKQPPLEALVPGEWLSCGDERCFVRTEQFPRPHAHGGGALGDLLALPSDTVAAVCAAGAGSAAMSQGATIDYARAVFLDIETTGLSQSAGTYAFLVGIGFFGADGFTVRQYFMPDYADEQAMLDLLAADLAPRQGLVTFNGRSFDWPILTGRYMLARRETPAVAQPHLDLLTVARRLWARVLPSCALSALEKTVLEVGRTDDDVPGYLIPQLYQDYLQWGDTRPLARVFYHNSMDILTMVTLACRVGRILGANLTDAADPYCDRVALGILYERWNQPEEAITAYRLALAGPETSAESRSAAALHLGSLLKRLARYDEAMVVWQSQLGGREVYPYVELAKQYEHRLRDYALAARLIREVLGRSRARASTLYIARETAADLEHRLARIEQKEERVRTRAKAPAAPDRDQPAEREQTYEC